MGEMNVSETSVNMKMYEELKKHRNIIYSIDKDFFFDFVDALLEKIKVLETVKPDCTDKEWHTCRVEKRGCEGCHYDIEFKKKRENKQ